MAHRTALMTYLFVRFRPRINNDGVDPQTRREVIHAAVSGDQNAHLVVVTVNAASPVSCARPGASRRHLVACSMTSRIVLRFVRQWSCGLVGNQWSALDVTSRSHFRQATHNERRPTCRAVSEGMARLSRAMKGQFKHDIRAKLHTLSPSSWSAHSHAINLSRWRWQVF